MRPWLLEGRVFGVGEESKYLSVVWVCSRLKGDATWSYLWSEQVEDDSPPKEEAMVLNSTCLTFGIDDGSAVSL